jgi:hypothetical protein
MEKEVDSANTKPEAEETKDLGSQVRTFLDQHADAPSAAKIEAWKAQYTDVFVSAFSNSEIFVFRCLNRKEYVDLQKQAASGELTNEQHEEETVKKCLLWSSVADLNAKAGNIPTLLEQIVAHSNFMPPQLAVQLVGKL